MLLRRLIAGALGLAAALFWAPTGADALRQNTPNVVFHRLPSATHIFVQSRAHGSWTKISSGTDGGFFAATPARTQANYDGLGTGVGKTWDSDSGTNPIQASGPAGIGCGSTVAFFAFSGSAADERTGNAIHIGGGHSDCGQGDILRWNLEQAASAYNASGGTVLGNWSLGLKGAKLLDHHTQTKPAWSFETTPSDTGTHQFYWPSASADGINMPMGFHSYSTVKFFRDGSGDVGIGGFFDFGQNSGACSNGVWIYNFVSNTITGPFNATTTPRFWCGGYTAQDSNNPTAVAYSKLDGKPYTFSQEQFAWDLFRWDNAKGSSIAATRVTDGTQQSTGIGATNDMIIFPHPGDATKEDWFAPITNTGTNQFLVIPDIAGTHVQHFQQYSSGAGTLPAGNQRISLAYDTQRSKIAISVCDQHIYHVTPSATLTAFTAAEFTSSPTGATPAFGSGDTSSHPTLIYLAAEDAYELFCTGQVWIYRP